MSLDTMHDLLVAQLKDLYSAEKQLTRALPKLARASTTEALATAFREHLVETEGQIERLDQIFFALEESPLGKRCKGMVGLLEEGDEMMDEQGEPGVVDAGLIADAQRVEHYEIAGYGSAKALAQLLGHEKIARLLDETLKEEIATDRKLAEIAESEVNPRAVLTGATAEYSR